MAGINSNASSGVIKKYIDAQDDKLQTNIDSEASARASADTTLQSNINKEASARLEGDNFLRADLTAETNARETADSALRTDVDTVTAGLSTETSERKTADSVLQGNIDAETTARTTKDGELESSIASEVTRAKNAESTLTANLNAEVTRAKNAEQANATAISNEASTRETNDNALSARIDVNAEDIAALKGRSIRYAVHLDSASPTQAQLTSAYQSASGSTAPPEDGTTLVDLNYNKEYTWFESSSTWVDRGSSTITPATNSSYGSVKGQTADGTVKADDGLLSVNGWSTVKNDISANAESISDEVSRATGAESTLQNNIDAEATARTSADTTLQANIDKKVTANTAITGGTFTKVTVDTKGLVTSGASLSASDIPTIAQSQVSGLTSALNGKQAVSNLVTAWQTTPDNTHYPSEKLVSDSITSEATARSESDATLQANINKKVTANANITAGTNCKITYDAKGLVTAGTSLSASDIPTIPESKVSNLVNDLAGKQAKLTAGDYISIGTDNTISHGSSGAVAGTYGNSGFAPKITVDGFGHITSVEDVSISADVANSLSTAGTIKVNLASSSAPTYTSGGNISPGVTGVLPVANGGTGNSSVDTVPTANSTKMVTSGGVASALAGKQDELTPGVNITISGTTISAKDTTYGVATASANGLMSSADKSKLDGIEAGAQKNTITGVKGSSETAYRTGNVSISKANIGLGNVDNTADSSKVVKGASEDGSGNVITDSYVASGEVSGQTVTLLSKSGNTLATFTTQSTDTKNTAGSTDTSSKIFLIGATSQAANPQTYSHDTAYVGTDGKLYSGSKVVIASGDTATAASKLATAQTIDGATFDGSSSIIHYGYCTTAGATAAKVVSIPGFTLVNGAIAIVRFALTNTASNSTLNVNNTGAIKIYYGNGAIKANKLIADTVYMFVYDGSYYRLIGSVDTTDTAGATDISAKIFLIGATSQTANAKTYSHDTVYVASNGKLYSGGKVVITAGDVDSALSSTSTNPVQNKVVNDALGAKQDKVTISTSDPSGGKDGDIWFKYEA